MANTPPTAEMWSRLIASALVSDQHAPATRTYTNILGQFSYHDALIFQFIAYADQVQALLLEFDDLPFQEGEPGKDDRDRAAEVLWESTKSYSDKTANMVQSGVGSSLQNLMRLRCISYSSHHLKFYYDDEEGEDKGFSRATERIDSFPWHDGSGDLQSLFETRVSDIFSEIRRVAGTQVDKYLLSTKSVGQLPLYTLTDLGKQIADACGIEHKLPDISEFLAG